MPSKSFYVSITGLRLRNGLYAPLFWWYAMRSMHQARLAAGNVSAEARTIDGVHHTLSVWESRAAMLAYLRCGAHRQAIRNFPRIATGKVLGMITSDVPAWADVPLLWRERGRHVGKAP
ncbi:MAG: hypothetical protein AAFO01_14355 [Pseudomonadota bacterium]